MGKSKKSFIDRRNAVKFKVVSKAEHNQNELEQDLPVHNQRHDEDERPELDEQAEQRKQKLLEYGIYFDDGYDYLQHLKSKENEYVLELCENPNQARKRKDDDSVPSVLEELDLLCSEYGDAAKVEETAACNSENIADVDPEILAALDGEIDCEELEDDFVLKGNAEDDDEDTDFSDYGDEIFDEVPPLAYEEKHCGHNQGLEESATLLDKRFDNFYETYDDMEIRDLVRHHQNEGGYDLDHPFALGLLNENRKPKKGKKTDDLVYDKEWDRLRKEKYKYIVEGDSDPEEELEEVEVTVEETQFDCVSVLSKNTNIYNHPKLIEEASRRRRAKKIEVDRKSGLPANVLRGDQDNMLTEKALARLESDDVPGAGAKSIGGRSIVSAISVLSIRPKDETFEEKRERKKLLKEFRKERRVERKANKEAFRDEQIRQSKMKSNARNNGYINMV